VHEALLEWLTPDWPAPEHIKAYSSTRLGGVSQAPWQSLNLATHVGDEAKHVAHNRQRLSENLHLPSEPCWLQQVHSNNIIEARNGYPDQSADGSYSQQKNTVCVVMTADCLPLLMCDREGTQVAAVHAGWRGMADGILQATIARFRSSPENILVWLGPAIGADAFEVGEDVYQAFIQRWPQSADAFRPNSHKKYQFNLYQQARMLLASVGVQQVTGGGFCTYTDNQRFFSYRRDGTSGRMASLIWIQ